MIILKCSRCGEKMQGTDKRDDVCTECFYKKDGPKPNYEGFSKALIKVYWDGMTGDIDSFEFQELAEKFGIIKQVKYDPEIHGEGGYELDLEKGDDWFIPNWEKK